MSANNIEFATWEDSGFSLMAYVTGGDGTAIEQADITSIAYTAFSIDSDGVATAMAITGTLTVSTVVFNTLQTDARWTKDATGYNFRWDVPASLVPTGGIRERIEIAFTPASGEVFHVVAEGYVRPIHRS